jgi:hypothetical protein
MQQDKVLEQQRKNSNKGWESEFLLTLLVFCLKKHMLTILSFQNLI